MAVGFDELVEEGDLGGSDDDEVGAGDRVGRLGLQQHDTLVPHPTDDA